MSETKNKSINQRIAEEEVEDFWEDLGPFVVAAETTRTAMVFTNAKEPDHPIIFANDSFLTLTGYDQQEVLGQSFNALIAQDANPDALARLESAFEHSANHDTEIWARRKDGSPYWAAIFVSPVCDEAGHVVQHFSSFVDLSKHKREQVQLRLLVDELNHRVKNTLSTVQSIIAQAFRRSSDPGVIRESIESRVFALSRSHDLLSHGNWEGAGLFDLINVAMQPFSLADGRTERLVIMGEDIRFPPKATLALGIAFHELATNAVKHGALSNEAGSILIAWTIEPTLRGDRLILRWREKDGPPVTPPSRKGLGAQVIERGLAHELEGAVHLDYPADGVVCTIDVPAPRGARDI
jgi:PAS domain S-box-containing protein